MHLNKRVELARLAGNSVVQKLCILLSFLLHHRVVFLSFSSACSLHDCLCLKNLYLVLFRVSKRKEREDFNRMN